MGVGVSRHLEVSVVCLVVNLGVLDIRTEMDTNTIEWENRMQINKQTYPST